MNTKSLKVIAMTALAVAAVVTMLTLMQSAAWKIDLGTLLFLVWAVSPYVVFAAAGAALERFFTIARQTLVFCLVALLMLVYTLVMYVGTLTGESSTEGLIFLFAPLYLYIGSFVLLVAGLIAAKLVERRQSSVPPLS